MWRVSEISEGNKHVLSRLPSNFDKTVSNLTGSLFWLGFNPHLSLTKLSQKYGDIFTITFGSYNSIILNSIDSVRETLVKRSRVYGGRPQLYSFTEIRAGLGILFIDQTPKYERQRKLAIRSLHRTFYEAKNLDVILNKEAIKLLGEFSKLQSEPFHPKGLLRLLAANLILKSFFDADFEFNGPEPQEVVEMVEDFTKNTSPVNLSDIVPWLQWLPIGDFSKMRKMFQDFVAMHERFYISTRRTRVPGVPRSLTDALLDNLPLYNKGVLGTCSEITETDLVYVLADLVGAAFETIANTLSWAIMLVAAHPDWQIMLQSELDAVVGKDRLPSLEDRNELPTLNAALYEVLRMSCVVPVSLPHSTTEDTQLREYNIPKGTFVFLNIWGIHHDPNYWEAPYEFNPGRFLHGDGKFFVPRHESFIPFSTGGRSCLGERLAKDEIFVFLAAIVQRFHLRLVNNENVNDFNGEYRLTLAPKPYLLQINERR
ncbi:cytochrome P450 1A1-like isoform X2 [Dendronephthya gigantea]|uniref:cytochrome P450 1A1-like isoform X2 n=1 Tax=Dendronephthya gigantea TaxID=151771 RepID=UPI00106B1DF3|nr:cytochrome P450 1A1-like isoform X2 [Dendronephthya gigantea]